jgi:RNA polymerase sigma factor (sigma-70 family)
VLRYFCDIGRADKHAAESDTQLLEQFVAHRSESAFTAILARHGPLVLTVCRRVLRDFTDADDAFQATFLVLARKAASIRNHDALAAWLHRVALNICQSARAAAVQRKTHERKAVPMSLATSVDESAIRDWRPLIHEEVDRLPEKYRALVILCYFEGMSHNAAARRLSCPIGTVKGRLARARDLLRTRLVRRGVTLTSTGLTAALAEDAAAWVPPALLKATLRAAIPFAAGQTLLAGIISAEVVTLAKGALQTMNTTKLLFLTPLLLMVGGLSLRVFLFAASGRERLQDQPKEAKGHGATEERAPEQVSEKPAPKELFGRLVNGLRAKVTLPNAKFEVGEPIPVTYVVKNFSGTEQILWHCGFLAQPRSCRH